jgi:hypothetical protein
MVDHLASRTAIVLGGDQAVADEQREHQETARLGVVLVDADLSEECMQVRHSPVVPAA